MKAIKNVLAITALGVFALATPALASYGGGSNAMGSIANNGVCATTQSTPEFTSSGIYGGMNAALHVVTGARNMSPTTTNMRPVAKANLPNSGDSGSNAYSGNSSPLICSTLQVNHGPLGQSW